MEHKLVQHNDISLAPEKMSFSPETLENSSTDQHSAIKSKILIAIGKIRKIKKRADLNAITDHILITEASNLDQDFLEMMISELINVNQIENRRAPQGIDSFWRTLSISPEQQEGLRSPVHEKCNNIFSPVHGNRQCFKGNYSKSSD